MRPLSLTGAVNYRGRFTVSVGSGDLLVLGRPNQLGNSGLRLGIVIPNRVCPKAVDRNRIRRIVRDTVRANVGERTNLDIVIRVKRLVLRTSHKMLTRELSELLKVF